MRIFIACLACAILPNACPAQIRLFAGAPTSMGDERFGIATAVARPGDTIVWADLLSDKSGVEWMSIHPDRSVGVVVPKWPDRRVLVLNSAEGRFVKQCDRPETPNLSLIARWLVDIPGRGITYTEYLAGDAPGSARLLGMTTSTTIRCESSFFEVPRDSLRNILAVGHTGIADIGSYDGLIANVDAEGRLGRRIGGENTLLGYRLPSAISDWTNDRTAAIQVNNSEVMAISMTGPAADSRLFVLRKRDSTWLRVRALSASFSWVRAFGHFIAIVRSAPKQMQVVESSGSAAWRNGRTKHGPAISGRLLESRFAFPGTLFLFDADGDRLFTIDTEQADSEILLVENDLVYYRVSDRLLRGKMTGTQITDIVTIAQSPDLLDVHWASPAKKPASTI